MNKKKIVEVLCSVVLIGGMANINAQILPEASSPAVASTINTEDGSNATAPKVKHKNVKKKKSDLKDSGSNKASDVELANSLKILPVPAGSAALVAVPDPQQELINKDVNLGTQFKDTVGPLLGILSAENASLELKKTEVESLKLDLEKQKLINSISRAKSGLSDNASNDGKIIDASNINNNHISIGNNGASAQLQKMQEVASLSSGIKVLMIFGYDDNLFAKVKYGSQGGYVVKRGDILPNSMEVVSVSQNYIEVRMLTQKPSATQKIYVLAEENEKDLKAAGQKISSTGKDGSASLAPFLLGPLSMPQATLPDPTPPQPQQNSGVGPTK